MRYTLEDKLLLLAAKPQANREEWKAILKEPLNWDYLYHFSLQHRFGALFYYQLTRVETNLSGPIVDRLRQDYEKNLSRNRRIYLELIEIIKSFNQAGIEMIVLKGPVLASIAYPDIGLRQMYDLDLLVKETDWTRVKDCLYALGYTLKGNLPELSNTEVVNYSQYFSQIEFERVDSIPIEIHFRLFNMGLPKQEDVWTRAIKREISGIEMLTPSLDDLLLHICIHANTHNYCSLMLLCDIAYLLNGFASQFDLTYLERVCRKRRISSSIYHTLYFTQLLLSAQTPQGLLDALRPNLLQQKLFSLIWNKRRILALKSKEKPAQFEAPSYYLLEMDTWSDKLCYLYRILFPPMSWLSAHFKTQPNIWFRYRYLLEKCYLRGKR